MGALMKVSACHVKLGDLLEDSMGRRIRVEDKDGPMDGPGLFGGVYIHDGNDWQDYDKWHEFTLVERECCA